MSDDLVKRLDNLWAMLEGEGYYTKANTVVLAKGRIEELEAKLDWVLVERDETFALMLDRAQTAEAKLAKAVEALRFYAEADNYEDQHKPESCGCCYYLHDAEIKEDEGAKARTTLAELKGGKDE